MSAEKGRRVSSDGHAERPDAPAGGVDEAVRLGATDLYRACDRAQLGFGSTAELEPHDELQYQEDAVAALNFGLEMRSPGYNIFVLGAPGSGRWTHTRLTVAPYARGASPPADLCYVYNFRDPREPCALQLPAGRAVPFRADVDKLVTDLRSTIPRLLQSEAVGARRATLVAGLEKRAATAVESFEKEIAADEYVTIDRSADSLEIVPARGHDVLRRDAYLELPADVRATIDEHVQAAQARHFAIHREIDELKRQAAEEIEAYHRSVIADELARRLEPLQASYGGFEPVVQYLDALLADVVEHSEQFLAPMAPDVEGPARVLMVAARDDFFRRYTINVITSTDPSHGAPVVEESNPTFVNLLGRMEHRIEFGVMTTDFTRITAGALHRANGGFLLLDAEELLTRPLAWPALKRVLRTGEVQPTEAATEVGLVATETMRPDAIPVRLKVVLIGEPRTYYLLRAVDDEFGDLFKVKADFRPQVGRTAETERGYATFIAAQCRQDGLPPLDAAAVACTIEEGARIAEDQHRLTTRLSVVQDLVREAAHLASAAGADVVGEAQMQEALLARERRNARPHRELLDLVRRGVLRFEPVGSAVGQLYGIGLISTGETRFGRPIRVMASAFLGTGGIIDIEREVKLSGPLHQKGFLVLSGYLGRRFARRRPLILSASVSFDQLYEEVEGDSASAAELYALMSAIGQIPLHKGIAVTGAVNQEGILLPVGGVTDKVEGFFAACEAVGLTGEQGVLLPRANIQNLVLKKNVRDAVRDGRFHVWAVDRIEEGWRVLADRDAGEEREDGTYPDATVHAAVQRQLDAWARWWNAQGERTGGSRADEMAHLVR